MEAARNLEAANLGKLVSITSSNGRFLYVFVKKHPDEMREPLIGNEDLCDIHRYADHFEMEAPRCITPNILQKLVESGHLQEAYLHY